MLYLLVYIDDIVLTGNSPFLNILIQQLRHAFELKDLGPLHYFLGLHITRISKELYLNQSKYAQDLLQKHNMLSSKADHTPCAPNLRLVPNEGHFLAKPHEYRNLVEVASLVLILAFLCIKCANSWLFPLMLI